MRRLVIAAAATLFFSASGSRFRGRTGSTCGTSSRWARGKPGDVIEMLAGEMPFCFDHCALVGSSADMVGRGHGAEIDAHDTVIRVNRLPSPNFYEDFGRRTDVYFAEPGMNMLEEGAYRTAFLGGPNFGGTKASCNLRTGLMEGNLSILKQEPGIQCPFGAMILKGTDSEKYNMSWEGRFPEDKPGASFSEAAFPLGHQSSAINGAAALFPGLEQWEPTSGFQAVLTFAPICGAMRLYGFSGSGTSDNHVVSKIHDMGMEHSWLRRLQLGMVPGPAFDDPRNGGKPKSVASLNWLRDNLNDLAWTGGLKVITA